MRNLFAGCVSNHSGEIDESLRFRLQIDIRVTARHVKKALTLDTAVTVSAEIGDKAQIADFKDIAPWCVENGIRLRYADRYDLKTDADLEFFQKEKFDIGFVNGWQRLVPNDVLSTFRIGVFGMHGSAANLPIGRGRSS